MSPHPVVWLINGIPGVGKTTTARRLAERLPRSAHIEGDALQEMVVSGKLYPGREPRDESDRQIRLCVENQCRLAAAFCAAGFTPVLDYVVVDRARLCQYEALLPEKDLRLVTLSPGPQVALARDLARPEKTVAPLWVHLHEILVSELSGAGLWIDNGNLSVDEVVDRILHASWDSRSLPPSG